MRERFPAAANVTTRRRAFSLVEMLICTALALCLVGGLFVSGRDSEETTIRRDFAALENWLAGAMARAGRWRSDFDLNIVIPLTKGSRPYATVTWQGGGLAAAPVERFNAAPGVSWRLNVSARRFLWRWSTHSVSPAFVLSALNSAGRLSGDSLTVSLRGQITRKSSGGGQGPAGRD